MDDTGQDINKGITGRILITGGAGTLGRAIVRRAKAERWDCDITIYSRDPLKHQHMKREYPGVRFVLGDIQDYDALYRTATGMDVILHLAAQKHIPEAESNSIDCLQTNINGSINVATAALQAGIKRVVATSTDKVARPINCYGVSKKAMEYVFAEFNRMGLTTFHLCRYGNVLGSNGSVLRVWREQLERDGYVTATDPDMTRFWITEDEAVDLVLAAYNAPAGTTVIPLAPALDMRRFAEYTMPEGTQFRYAGLRPGEKMHEELFTAEERHKIFIRDGRALLYDLAPGEALKSDGLPYQGGYVSSNPSRWLTPGELRSMLGES